MACKAPDDWQPPPPTPLTFSHDAFHLCHSEAARLTSSLLPGTFPRAHASGHLHLCFPEHAPEMVHCSSSSGLCSAVTLSVLGRPSLITVLDSTVPPYFQSRLVIHHHLTPKSFIFINLFIPYCNPSPYWTVSLLSWGPYLSYSLL